MSPVTRSWVALASIGAGLIYLALVRSATLPVGSVFAVFGVAGFAWGVLVLFDARFLAPRVSLVAALVPIVAWLVMLLSPALASDLRPYPLGVAAVLELFVALALALHLRRRAEAAAPSTRWFVAAVAVGILVIGGAVVPAIVAADAAAPAPSFEDGVHH